MFKQFHRSDVHRAARFAVGMSATEAEALCNELNLDRDATGDMAAFNGAVIFIASPLRSSPLVVEPGNWIVVKPDKSMDVRADDDFCRSFCSAAS
jgi:hypothetical protein